jgi:hypothetical protein
MVRPPVKPFSYAWTTPLRVGHRAAPIAGRVILVCGKSSFAETLPLREE